MISFKSYGPKIIGQVTCSSWNVDSKNYDTLNLKIYLNGKRLRKKIIVSDNSWRFVKPLKLTKKDILTYTWEVKCG